jgi:hypothetical protein
MVYTTAFPIFKVRDPVNPFKVALICVAPTATGVTTPKLSTTATDGLEEVK